MRFSYGEEKITAYRASNKELTIRGVDTLPKSLKDDIVNCKSKTAKYRQFLAQRFVDVICAKLGIQSVRVKVYESPRPKSKEKDGNYSQIYGMYSFDGANKPIKLEIWNKNTIRGGQITNGSFLDTLEHELMHHYDICYLEFETTPHTKGFFKRMHILDKMLSVAS